MRFDEVENSLEIIRCLSSSQWRSGASIACQLGISRAAVWKRINKLAAHSVCVERCKRRGYRLIRAFELLDEERIRRDLKALVTDAPDVSVSLVSDSTNTELLGNLRCGVVRPPAVLIAEAQTSGRGRRGRAWASPLARNLYLSYGWRCEAGVAALSGLSLAVGTILADTIRSSTGLDVRLKWPNDLLLDGQKCGGVLIDLDGDLDGAVYVVIGIGLNIDMRDMNDTGITQQWTDLNAHAISPVSRNDIASRLISDLCVGLSLFGKSGFPGFKERWITLDALAGMEVSVTGAAHNWIGRAAGVSDSGGLLIDLGGETIEVSAGDVSLRLR